MATVERDDQGNLVLIDPDAVAMIHAVEKHNCKLTLEANRDRVSHFRQRFIDRGDKADDVVIVLANVNDRNGAYLAGELMPGMDWQAIRDQGEIPFARGLAGRDGVQVFLNSFDDAASKKLGEFDGLAVVVVDHGVAEIFEST